MRSFFIIIFGKSVYNIYESHCLFTIGRICTHVFSPKPWGKIILGTSMEYMYIIPGEKFWLPVAKIILPLALGETTCVHILPIVNKQCDSYIL